VLIGGPFELNVGTTIEEYDPNIFGPPSETCQVQNNSGFGLIVEAGGAQNSIPPFSAVTINLNTSTQVVITPSAILSNFGGTATLVWLAAGEESPTPDGPLSTGNTNQGGLSIVSALFLPTGVQTLLDAPASGFAYRLHAVTYFVTGASATPGYVRLDTATVGPIFAARFDVVAAGDVATETLLLNGLLSDSDLIVTGAGASNPAEVEFVLNYDTVQI
jgi:hypothetical protein